MTPFVFACRSLTRQPARAVLGIAGIAVVGALLFDMLLLSRGLVESLKQLMDEGGYDVRITASDRLPGDGPLVRGRAETIRQLGDLPEVAEVLALRFGETEVSLTDATSATSATSDEQNVPTADLLGASGSARDTWSILEGSDLPASPPSDLPHTLVNRSLARELGLSPGSALWLRGRCGSSTALPPVEFRVAGIVDLKFDSETASAVVGLADFESVCSDVAGDRADLILLASRSEAGPDGVVAAVARARPDLQATSNQELVDRLQMREFSYYRQISFVLSTMTLFFAFLLIATLLTVSVNQRLGEIATLRALGFPRRRVVADLLWESALLVGTGGLLGFPLGHLLARQLDAILRSIPEFPDKVEFFFFQPRVVLIYGALLAVTGLLAALYPVILAARLPIAATLRREVL